MSLIETIGADYITAFKAKEMDKKNFLGLVKSTLTEKTKEPSDDEVIALLKSMLKKHDKSLNEYGAGTLTDVEVKVIEGYLPEQYSEETITEIVKEIVENADNKNSGFIMGMFQKEHRGKADNKLVSKVIKEQLA
jgi:uncharacterized protein YqeY